MCALLWQTFSSFVACSLTRSLSPQTFIHPLATTVFFHEADIWQGLQGKGAWNWEWPFAQNFQMDSPNQFSVCEVKCLHMQAPTWSHLLHISFVYGQGCFCVSKDHIYVFKQVRIVVEKWLFILYFLPPSNIDPVPQYWIYQLLIWSVTLRYSCQDASLLLTFGKCSSSRDTIGNFWFEL